MKREELENQGFDINRTGQSLFTNGQAEQYIPPDLDEPIEWLGHMTQPQPQPTQKTNNIKIIRIALDVLALRLLLYITAIFGFAIFGYAAVTPSPWTFASASAYVAGVFIPTLIMYGRK